MPLDIPQYGPKIIHPKGPENSPFVIIGEAPGRQEVKLGEPFVGPSGIVLNHALDQFKKGSYPEPYILNAVPHIMPKTKDNNVMAELASKWHDEVIALIAKHPRKVILALGNVALWSMTGNYGLKITQQRGKRFSPCKEGLSEFGVVAATHPAFLLRGNGNLRQFKSDIAYAVNLSRGGKPHEFVPPTWSIIEEDWQLEDFLYHAEESNGLVGSDIETGGFKHRQDKVLMSGYTFDGDHVYVIPGLKREWVKGGIRDRHPQLKPLFANQNLRFNWHNGKFDIKFLNHQYQLDARVDEDTMLMSYALDETRGIHDLETVSGDWLGSPNWKNILDSYKKKKESYDVIPEEILTKYMAYDIANTHNLGNLLLELIAEDPISELQYRQTLIPASKYLARIESAGLYVDPVRVEENRIEYQGEVDKYREELNAIAIESGYGPINPNSPLQLSDFLYNTLKLPTKIRGTGIDILEKLPPHPAVTALMKYRKVQKGLSTYVTPILEHAQDDGRVHSTYLIHGTATGRLSSRDPNLQNIPREPKLRGQFIPAPDKIYLEIDLNQAELRSLAALSGDPTLCGIYTDSDSKGLHEEVRAEIYGYPEQWDDFQLREYYAKWYTDTIERVLKEQKMRAKNVNFGIVYGITSAGLSEQIEGSVPEAQSMLDAWARKFPLAWGFIEKCRQAPLKGMNLKTPFGYRKRFQIITPETAKDIMNEAANFPHQSIASTITVHGGIRSQEQIKDEFGADIVNTVHDSILVELDDDETIVRKAAKIIIDHLEQVPIDWGITRIPFKADAEVGRRWGMLKPMKEFYAKENGYAT